MVAPGPVGGSIVLGSLWAPGASPGPKGSYTSVTWPLQPSSCQRLLPACQSGVELSRGQIFFGSRERPGGGELRGKVGIPREICLELSVGSTTKLGARSPPPSTCCHTCALTACPLPTAGTIPGANGDTAGAR